jgi:hypothetical protein
MPTLYERAEACCAPSARSNHGADPTLIFVLEDFWHQAQNQRFSERAYALWEWEGCPEGKADEHWFQTRAFEES